MTDAQHDPFGIPPRSIRAVWVFVIDLPPEEIEAFRTERYSDDGEAIDWPLLDALGMTWLDHDFIEVFDAKDIKGYGFANYLTEANGMDEASVAPDAEMLDALTGPVLLVFSGALTDDIARLSPRAPLRFIGRYAETADLSLPTPLRSAAARGILDSPEPRELTDAALSGRIAMLVLLVMFLLVAVMVWLAAS